MSLINDALKRASKPSHTPAAPAGGGMVPAEPPPPDYGKLLLSIFVLIVLVLVAGTFFWWKGSGDLAERRGETNVVAARAETPPSSNTVTGLAESPLMTAKVVNPITPPQVQTQAVPTARPAEREFPELKLSAIYFRLRGPTAVINGKTIRVGDEVDGVKVLQIQRNSVELEHLGKRKSLLMR